MNGQPYHIIYIFNSDFQLQFSRYSIMGMLWGLPVTGSGAHLQGFWCSVDPVEGSFHFWNEEKDQIRTGLKTFKKVFPLWLHKAFFFQWFV